MKRPALPRRPALIVQEMLCAYPEGTSIPRAGERLIAWNGFPSDHARFLEGDPNAFLFGLLFDRMMDATKAWQGPLGLARRLGHLDPYQLARASLVDAVVQSARRLHPSFLGALDRPAFDIGQPWCRSGGAACREGCPLIGVCPKDRTHWEIGTR